MRQRTENVGKLWTYSIFMHLEILAWMCLFIICTDHQILLTWFSDHQSYERDTYHVVSSSSSSSPSSSSLICQTTGPKPLAKRFLHIVRSRASSFNSQYPLLSSRSSSNFLRLLPCLLVISICPFIFPSITCFRRQFPRKMWPIQLAFRFIISCRIFLCSLYKASKCTQCFGLRIKW